MTQPWPANKVRYLFSIKGLDADFQVLSFNGEEGISQLYRFQVLLVAGADEENAKQQKLRNVDYQKVMGKAAVLTILNQPEASGGSSSQIAAQYRHGLISHFQLVAVLQRRTIYQAQLTCPLFRLTLCQNFTIFQDKTTQEIVTEVLNRGGIKELEWKLNETYKPRNYCVQYRETDMDFIARLLEEEGILYYFQHTKEAFKMVLTDNSVACPEIASPTSVPYHPVNFPRANDQEYVTTFTLSQQLCTDQVMLKDYNFKNPQEAVEGKSQSKEASGDQLQYMDYPGEFTEEELGKRLAKVRLQEIQAARLSGQGTSDCTRFTAGYAFMLGDSGDANFQYPRRDFNKRYLLVHLSHQGLQPHVLGEESYEGWNSNTGLSYNNQFKVIPGGTEFRPPRVTLRPLANGTHSATVVGPKNEDVWTDEYGRIKVQFHWDLQGQRDEKSSCWIRVAQIWAGNNYGALFIPRVGQEVLVSFLDGDPDRPIIIGQVYNAQQMPPADLPKEKTTSTIRSLRTPLGDDTKNPNNEIRFIDTSGKEELQLLASKDHLLRVQNNSIEQIHHDQFVWIDNDLQIEVKNEIKVKAKKISLEATEVEVIVRGSEQSPTAKINIAGYFGYAEVNVETNGKISLNGSNEINLNGKTIDIKGALVKINS